MCQLAVDYSHIIAYIILYVKQCTKKFAKKLNSIRETRGLSQEELAFLCGIDRTYIGRIERLERNPSLVVLQKIADGLGISLIELLTFD